MPNEKVAQFAAQFRDPKDLKRQSNPNLKEMTAALDGLRALGAKGVTGLVALLKPDSEGGDVHVRHALHGQAMRAGGWPEKDRQAFPKALAGTLNADHPKSAKGFVIRQLQVAGGAEVTTALGKWLLDDELSEDAAQALLAIGGTAVGTGINTRAAFGAMVAAELSNETGIEFTEAGNHFEAQAAQDAAVAVSGALKTIAVSMMKIANDIRLLAMGPRCGLGELKLPATQPGSSIMPGKVNPVMCESVIQVGAQVQANDLAVQLGGQWGQLELNTMLPLIARNLLESMRLLANVARVFTEKCLSGLEADAERCRSLIEESLSMVTSLNPLIGYDEAAKVAKEAFETGKTVRALLEEKELVSKEDLDKALDPESMTRPSE